MLVVQIQADHLCVPVMLDIQEMELPVLIKMSAWVKEVAIIVISMHFVPILLVRSCVSVCHDSKVMVYSAFLFRNLHDEVEHDEHDLLEAL